MIGQRVRLKGFQGYAGHYKGDPSSLIKPEVGIFSKTKVL